MLYTAPGTVRAPCGACDPSSASRCKKNEILHSESPENEGKEGSEAYAYFFAKGLNRSLHSRSGEKRTRFLHLCERQKKNS